LCSLSSCFFSSLSSRPDIRTPFAEFPLSASVFPSFAVRINSSRYMNNVESTGFRDQHVFFEKIVRRTRTGQERRQTLMFAKGTSWETVSPRLHPGARFGHRRWLASPDESQPCHLKRKFIQARAITFGRDIRPSGWLPEDPSPILASGLVSKKTMSQPGIPVLPDKTFAPLSRHLPPPSTPGQLMQPTIDPGRNEPRPHRPRTC